MSDIRLMHGDCLAILPTLAAGSVDAIVTDPPYGQTNEDYDGPIAFGADLWRECARVARPNAALISFAGSPTYHRVATAIESGGWRVRQMWGWVYRNGVITSAYPKEGFDRLAPAMDPICYATKGKILLNVEREGDEAWDRKTGRANPLNGLDGYSGRSRIGLAKIGMGRWPRTIAAEADLDGFRYFALNPNNPRLKAEKVGHPNQKPLALMRWLVSKLPRGSIVLDPFAGSGTTLIACLDEGLTGIGIENNATFVAMARARIAEHHAKTPLFAEVVP